MIATPVFSVIDVALQKRRPTEFAAPDDESIVEESALLEVLYESGARLIGIAALDLELRGEIAMMVPAGVETLHKAHPALNEPPRHETVVGEGPLALYVRPVHLQNFRRFVGEIGEFRHGGLHLVSHLVLRNPGGDLRVGELRGVLLVELREIVEQAAAHLARHAIGI